MKQVLALILIFSVSGCAIVNALTMSKFDNNEYAMVNDIRSAAASAKNKCGAFDENTMVDNLHYQALVLKNYSQYIPDNAPTIKMTTELYDIVQGLNDKYHGNEPVSAAYCKLKLGNIEKNAETIQKSLGSKPR